MTRKKILLSPSRFLYLIKTGLVFLRCIYLLYLPVAHITGSPRRVLDFLFWCGEGVGMIEQETESAPFQSLWFVDMFMYSNDTQAFNVSSKRQHF